MPSLASPPCDQTPSACCTPGSLDELQAKFWTCGDPDGHDAYQVIAHLGKGNYGTVVSARHRRTGQACAIKRIHRVFSLQDDAIKTLRELHFLRIFRHPNIVKLRHALVPENAEEFNDVFLVTELMETDLDRLIRSKTVLKDCHTRWIMYQLLRALTYMHGAGVSHRDVKPANILVDHRCNLKLCDLGLSRADFPREPGVPVFWTDYVATRWYRSPELLCSRFCCEFTTQVDMWAAGCIMGELMERRPMFPGHNAHHQLQLITLYCGTPSRQTLDKICSPNMREYMLRRVPRPPADASSQCAYCDNEYRSLLRGLLTFDPHDRLDATSGGQHDLFKEIRLSIDETCIPPPPQITKEDLPWEIEEPATTVDLRRMLYGEISALSVEDTGAHAITASIVKAAATKHTDVPAELREKQRNRLCSDNDNRDAFIENEAGAVDHLHQTLPTCTLAAASSQSDPVLVVSDHDLSSGSDSSCRGSLSHRYPVGVSLDVNLEKRDCSQTKHPSNAAGVLAGNTTRVSRRGALSSCCGSKPKQSL